MSKKLLFLFLTAAFLIITCNLTYAQVSTLWQKSSATTNLPLWFGTDTERGFAYGKVNNNDRLYVVTRKGGNNIIILDAATGDSLGKLDMTGVSGGTFAVNDVEVSSDGKIFACNVSTTAAAAYFSVYKWDSESAVPVKVININAPTGYRLGDKFTVVGSTADNSITIYAAVSSNNKILRYTTTDNGATFTQAELVASGLSGATPAVCPTGTGVSGYLVNANSISPKEYDANNVLLGTIPSEIVPTGSNAIKYIELGGRRYFATYLYGVGLNYARIIDVTGSTLMGTFLANTPSLGSATNSNGTGDIAIKDNGDGTFNVYVLASNNGIAAYTVSFQNLSSAINPPFLYNLEGTYPQFGYTRWTGLMNSNNIALTTTTSGWVQDDFANITSPVNKAAKLNVYGTSVKTWLVTPPVDLKNGTKQYQLEFDLALTPFNGTTATALGADDKFNVVISTNEGATWDTAKVLRKWTATTPISNTGEHVILDLTGYTGRVRFGFYGESTVSNADLDLFIDNIEVKEIPTLPIFAVNPTSKDFGALQVGTLTQPQTFTVKNSGVGTLTINSVALANNDSSFFVLTDLNTYPKNLAGGESITLNVHFAPTTVGAKSAILRITDNTSEAVHDIALTGSCYDATIKSFPYTQGFTGTFPPQYYERFMGLLGSPNSVLTTTTSGWITDDFANITSPVNKSAKINLYGTTNKYWLVTPPIDLGTGKTYQAEFDLALTAFGATTASVLGPDDKFYVIISTDMGTTWDSLKTLKKFNAASVISNTGQHEIISLDGYSGKIKLAFYTESTVSNKDNDLFVDSLVIKEAPALPVFAVSPASKDFGTLQINSTSPVQNFTISNSGAGVLTINSVALANNDSSFFILTDNNTYPKNLGANESITVGVAFKPTTVGLKGAKLVITDNLTETVHDVLLSGTGFDATINTFPYAQGFEGGIVPPIGWANPGNYWTKGTEAHSGSFAAKVSYNYSSVNNAILMSPPVVLPANHRIKFWWSDQDITEKVKDHDSTFFEISTDGTNWTKLAVLSAAAQQTAYTEQIVDLSAYGNMTVYLRWRDKTDGSYSAYGTGLDDITIEAIPVAAVDWCNLQWPVTVTIAQGDTTTAYARVYEPEVTVGAGQGAGIKAWIGISTTNTNPATWTTWVPAVYNTDYDNNDEYMAKFGYNLAAGNYYFASRFQLNDGPFKYGGFSPAGGNFWDSTTCISGLLTVNPFTVSNFPMTEGFEAVAFPPTGWTVENANNDLKTWIRATESPRTGVAHARYAYSGTNAANDWLFTPALALNSAKAYRLTYSFRAQSASYAEKLRVKAGTAPNAAGMDTLLAEYTDITNPAYLTYSVIYKPKTTGLIYFGFQCFSDADKYNLNLDDISVTELPEFDYAVTSLTQKDAVPTPYEDKNSTFIQSRENLQINLNGLNGVKGSDLNNSLVLPSLPSGYDENKLVGNNPVTLMTVVSNFGLQSPQYTVNWSVAGVAGTQINRPGIPVAAHDTVLMTTTAPLQRGTVTSLVTIAASGDTFATNNTANLIRTLVYPDSMIRIKYDNGQNIPNTLLGFGSNNLPLTAAVRFKATKNMRLANIDAYYGNEANTDSVTVTVWAAGADSTAPGAVLYKKKFAGINYISSTGDYMTLPLGTDAPAFVAGTTYWVSLSFTAAVQFPMGAHQAPLTTPGHSRLTSDGITWYPVVISSVEYAWLLRVVGVPYTPPPPPVITTLWERKAANNTLPSWFSTTNTERGFAYGYVNNNKRIYVVNRNGGNFVRILDAETGNDVDTLRFAGISGGTLPLNDIEVTADGKIIGANLAIVNQAFKVYMWNSETSAPVNIINYTSTVARLGDKFTVYGDYSAGTAVILAASATTGQGKIYKWTMTGGSFNANPEVITLSDNAAGGSASVSITGSGDFLWKATGASAKKYGPTGTILGTVPGTVVATGSNAIKYIGMVDGKEYFSVFQYGAGNENGRIVEMTGGDPTQATTFAVTPTLGSNGNTNGAGDIAVKLNGDGTADIFVLSTNNGIGAYRTLKRVPVELVSFTATQKNKTIELKWMTATETNSSYFEIERKADDGQWLRAGSVRAMGSSSVPVEYSFIDKNLNFNRCFYRLKQVDLDGSFRYSKEVEMLSGVPAAFELSQNYPNPFNPATRINYTLPANSHVKLAVFSVTGELVEELVNTEQTAGYYSVEFNAGKYASGMYIYRIIAGNNVQTRKMLLIK